MRKHSRQQQIQLLPTLYCCWSWRAVRPLGQHLLAGDPLATLFSRLPEGFDSRDLGRPPHDRISEGNSLRRSAQAPEYIFLGGEIS